MQAATVTGLQHDVGAQRLEHIGASRLRRHRAIAVLGHARAGRGRDEHRRGRDVERVRRVAAGADDVDQMLAVGHVDLGGKLAHHLRGRRDLADRLLLDAQPDGQGGDHHRRHFAAHDLPHQRQHLVVKDFAMLDRALQRILQSDRHDRQPLFRAGDRARGGASCRRGSRAAPVRRRCRSHTWPSRSRTGPCGIR